MLSEAGGGVLLLAAGLGDWAEGATGAAALACAGDAGGGTATAAGDSGAAGATWVTGAGGVWLTAAGGLRTSLPAATGLTATGVGGAGGAATTSTTGVGSGRADGVGSTGGKLTAGSAAREPAVTTGAGGSAAGSDLGAGEPARAAAPPRPEWGAPCSSRPRRFPRRESRGAAGAVGAAPGAVAGGVSLTTTASPGAASLGTAAGAALAPPATLPAPPRRRRPGAGADSVVPVAGLLLSVAFAAVLSSTDPSVTAVSVLARPLPVRVGMFRSPNTPGLTRTKSVDGRRASACNRDCIISSGSRPTTESRSYFRARRVRSLK